MSFRDLIWALILAVPDDFWRTLTWLGDSGLLLPAALLIALWLASSRKTWPTAALWVALFGSASVLILATKLAFLGWGIGSARWNFTGISGHTAISTSVWPVALWLVASRMGHRIRMTLALAGWLLAAVIGVSRLALYAHSASEVVTGFVLGTVVAGTFLVVQHRMPHPVLRGTLVALSLLLPLSYQTPGHPAPTQDALESMAVRLAGIEHPYTREDLFRD
ncbi:phosphatase PAP2 family protein [Variovorax sp. J22R133]|uniref:phosphatase PAP2 family protein n=1 Tax=Variovorax brevis TaxID=3053503 RepID=UPI002574B907|nr:phosphatase PAP2 family protein [Variovorax sp. J22R133]MDM0115764.1 phosphatase PAP2 family protein [Variovorax sp. J22R133]